MNISIFFISLLFLSSCGLLPDRSPKEGKTVYSFSDITGQYQFQREQKKIDNSVVTRTVLLAPRGSSKVVEKSVTVSHLGSVKSRKGRVLILRPQASEFVVWLEGKKYESKMKLNTKNRSMIVSMSSPEAKWQGEQEIPFPKGKIFCFFSQLPECLYHTQQLSKVLNNPQQDLGFYIIWDSFPYTGEQLSEIGNELFASALLKFETEDRGLLRFLVEVKGQSILYHFSKSFELIKISWIAQGISVVPLGEQINSVDE